MLWGRSPKPRRKAPPGTEAGRSRPHGDPPHRVGIHQARRMSLTQGCPKSGNPGKRPGLGIGCQGEGKLRFRGKVGVGDRARIPGQSGAGKGPV